MASDGDSTGTLLSAGGALSIMSGILQIISGVLATIVILSPDIVMHAQTFWLYMLLLFFPYALLHALMSDLLSAEIVIFPICTVVMGIVAIVGGTLAISRKNFRLSLAGAICSIPTVILGVLAIIFVSASKKEFK